jgi:hypothetical protein
MSGDGEPRFFRCERLEKEARRFALDPAQREAAPTCLETLLLPSILPVDRLSRSDLIQRLAEQGNFSGGLARAYSFY